MQRDIIGVIIAITLTIAAIVALGWMAFAGLQHAVLSEVGGKGDLLLLPDHLREGGR